MKFHFTNLGAIDKAAVELAPLTVICGRNNTGKTYVTYAIYALLSAWRQLVGWQVDVADMDKLLRDGAVAIDLDAKFVDNWEAIRENTSRRWQEFLPNALAAPPERFKDTTLTFELTLDSEWRTKPFKKEFRSEQGRILFSAEKAPDSGTIEFVALRDESDKWRDLSGFALEDFVSQALMEAVIGTYFPPVFMVSTERTGAVAFKEELNLTKNKIVSLLAKMESGKEAINPGQLFEAVYRRGYPLPVESNVQFVNRLTSLEGRTGPLMTQHPLLAQDFESIAGGRYETTKDGITAFVPKGSTTRLQLSEASSAVRSLVVFWYWLKAQAAEGHILLVDEPELNLHPENQRTFARFLAKLVNLKIQVLITTHSDTMLREFNTLIMLSRSMEHTGTVREKFGYADGERLNPDQVKLYVANGMPRTSSGRKKSGALSTLECIVPDARLGFSAKIFDATISEMNSVQDALRYGAV
jgi:hypothetical protein